MGVSVGPAFAVSQPTPVFLPGKPRAQKSLAGYNSSWGCKESDVTERLSLFTPSIRTPWKRFRGALTDHSANLYLSPRFGVGFSEPVDHRYRFSD